MLQEALNQRDFDTDGETFLEWSAVLNGLRHRLETAVDMLASKEASLVADLLDHPPLELAVETLREVRKRLIPNGDLPAARSVLDVLASSDALEDSEFREDYKNALAELRNAHEYSERTRHDLVQRSIAIHFESASQRFGEHAIIAAARAVSERGRVWPAGRA